MRDRELPFFTAGPFPVWDKGERVSFRGKDYFRVDIINWSHSTIAKVFGYEDEIEERVEMFVAAFRAQAALKKILEMAERSDAHPDVQIAEIARAAL